MKWQAIDRQTTTCCLLIACDMLLIFGSRGENAKLGLFSECPLSSLGLTSALIMNCSLIERGESFLAFCG